MRQLSYLTLSLLASMLVAGKTYAHAEHDKARFVAPTGTDKGLCDTPVRPCKTISYAVSKANKGDKVLVASGNYTITDEAELFYLESELVPVFGGYNRFDHYQVQNPNTNKTVLSGVPAQMQDKLYQAGFKILNDGKSNELSQTIKAKLERNQALAQSHSNLTCNNGRAGEFSCNNVDLVAHVPLPSGVSGNDVWGHIDLNSNIEYAIMGFSDGTRVYSLADPSNPKLVGHISGLRTSWRDIKVLQYYDKQAKSFYAYAYVSSESSNGIQIIDLNQLPEKVSLANTSYLESSGHNVYIENVDYSLNVPLNQLAARLQVVGADSFGGAFASFHLTDPTNLRRSFSHATSLRSNYTHDATSLVIEDARAATHCDNAQCQVLVDFNENEIRLWNTSNSAQTKQLGSTSYSDVPSNAQYVHSGWWHENKRYVYVHDEFDESRAGINTTVRIMDVNDLENPFIAGKWSGSNSAIDHNGFVRGNRYYMSNYERGLTVLDISDPLNPVEVGFFDTFPSSNNASYNGAWGTYPYLPSGNILVSDINSGLYVVKDTSRATTTNLAFANANYEVEQGGLVTVNVTKSGASNSATSVDFEILAATLENNEYTVLNSSNTLTWEAGDSTEKTIQIQLNATSDNSEKLFFVKLTNASNGLQLADQHITKVKVLGEASKGAIGFVNTNLELSETQTEVNLDVARTGGSAGDISATYEVLSNSANEQDVVLTSGVLNWQDGDTSSKQVTITLINDDAAESTESFSVRLSDGANGNLISRGEVTVTIYDDESNTAPKVVLDNQLEMALNARQSYAARSVADDASLPLTYQWQVTSGNSVSLLNANTETPTLVSGVNAGESVVTLSVSDIHGAVGQASVTVKVIATSVTEPEPNNSSSGGALGTLLAALGLFAARKRIKQRAI